MKLYSVRCSYSFKRRRSFLFVFVSCDDIEVAKSLAFSYCNDVLHLSKPFVEYVTMMSHFIDSQSCHRLILNSEELKEVVEVQ